MKKTVSFVAGFIVIASLFILAFPTESTSAKAGKTRVGLPVIREGEFRFVPGRILVGFRSNVGLDHARQIIAALGARDAGEIPGTDVRILDLPSQASEAAFAHAFSARDEVEFAELDHLLPAEQVVPNDPLYDNLNAWSLPKIAAPEAWSVTTGSSNIVIAVLDSGVDASHPDLASQIVTGWNIYDNNSDTSDVQGHGTSVAGVAAAASNNALGVTSVAWGCRLMPVRVTDTTGMAPESAIASGLTWAADHGARIANVSFYVTGSRTISSAAKNFQNRGGLVVAAAGNYGVSETVSNDQYVVTVGATDQSDVLYSWSNRGNNLDLVAPGSVYTTARFGMYGVGGGTSYASPTVAGVAALVLSLNPSLTGPQVENILKLNADDLGVAGWDPFYGEGRVNAARAVAAAAQIINTRDGVSPSITITSPGQGDTVTGTINVEVSVSDNVGVVKSQLYVDNVLVVSSTTAPFTLKWNTRKLKSGQHVLKSKAFDAAGNAGTSEPITVIK
jgi:subtilisin family serine protease